jgi:hypothetical protein
LFPYGVFWNDKKDEEKVKNRGLAPIFFTPGKR